MGPSHAWSLLRASGIVALLLATPAPARELPALDAFMVGLERSCRHGPDYQRFADSLFRREGERLRLAATPSLPEALRAVLGRPTYRDADDVAVVTVPVRGTFHGMPVSALRVMRGHASPAAGDGIVIEAPLAEAQRVLADLVAASRRGLTDVDELVLEQTEDGSVVLECFSAV